MRLVLGETLIVQSPTIPLDMYCANRPPEQHVSDLVVLSVCGVLCVLVCTACVCVCVVMPFGASVKRRRASLSKSNSSVFW